MKKRRKKKRKLRLPKTYDPNVQPDPERWLPKYERSTFKRKKKAKDRDIGRGTQGAAASSAQSDLDSSGKLTQSPDVNASPKPGAAVPGPRQQRPAGQQAKIKKKKGGKGGKW